LSRWIYFRRQTKLPTSTVLLSKGILVPFPLQRIANSPRTKQIQKKPTVVSNTIVLVFSSFSLHTTKKTNASFPRKDPSIGCNNKDDNGTIWDDDDDDDDRDDDDGLG
jgi:hypothetical protein